MLAHTLRLLRVGHFMDLCGAGVAGFTLTGLAQVADSSDWALLEAVITIYEVVAGAHQAWNLPDLQRHYAPFNPSTRL